MTLGNVGGDGRDALERDEHGKRVGIDSDLPPFSGPSSEQGTKSDSCHGASIANTDRVTPASTENERGQFPMTRWSLILEAKEGDEDSRLRAMAELCEHYWYPLYAYVRRRGYSKHDAEDLTQGFFSQLLEKDRIQLFSREKGRLRAYLLGAIKNFLKSDRTRECAQKRGGGIKPLSIDVEQAEERYALEPTDTDTPEKLFELRWALELLEGAFTNLGHEYERAGKTPLYSALKAFVAGGDPQSRYQDVADELGITVGNARVALHRMRKRYRLILEDSIRDTVADPDDIEDEIDYLHRVFG